MSDPKQNAALTSRDVTHIVEAAGTHSLISASVLSSRVITEATAYFERSAAALEQILTTLKGDGADGKPKPMGVTATLEPSSAKLIADTLTSAIQPQLDKHGEMLATLQTQLAQQATQVVEHGKTLTGLQTQLGQQAAQIAESHRILTTVLLGEEGQIRRLELEVAALALRLTQLQGSGGSGAAAPGGGEASAAFAEEAQAMREAREALHDRMSTVEAAIRQMRARGPEGGGTPRSRRS